MDEMIDKVKNGYTINIYKDKLELSKAVFKFIECQIVNTLKNKERFKFCVSGGSTPKSVYQLLSNSNLKWDFVDVFLGDERCVDPNSELSNSLMLKNSLLTNFGSKAFFMKFSMIQTQMMKLQKNNLFQNYLKNADQTLPPLI